MCTYANYMKIYDVIIIGGGQAGLSSARYIQKLGLDFLILEKEKQLGGSWAKHYESLKLFSPDVYSSLPDLEFPKVISSYPTKNETVTYLKDYASYFKFPVETEIQVVGISKVNQIFELKSDNNQNFFAKSIVLATGTFGFPYLPNIKGLETFNGQGLHSSEYQSPTAFKNQKITVVGGGNSAVQIAYELSKVAKVSIAIKSKISFLPQKILGKDIHFWLKWSGLDHSKFLKDKSPPVLDTGIYRKHIKSKAIDVKPMFDEVVPEGVRWNKTNIVEEVDTLLFATGFSFQFPMLSNFEILNKQGKILHKQGIATEVAGLYFNGYPNLNNFSSGTIRGAAVGPSLWISHLSNYLKTNF